MGEGCLYWKYAQRITGSPKQPDLEKDRQQGSLGNLRILRNK